MIFFLASVQCPLQRINGNKGSSDSVVVGKMEEGCLFFNSFLCMLSHAPCPPSFPPPRLLLTLSIDRLLMSGRSIEMFVPASVLRPPPTHLPPPPPTATFTPLPPTAVTMLLFCYVQNFSHVVFLSLSSSSEFCRSSQSVSGAVPLPGFFFFFQLPFFSVARESCFFKRMNSTSSSTSPTPAHHSASCPCRAHPDAFPHFGPVFIQALHEAYTIVQIKQKLTCPYVHVSKPRGNHMRLQLCCVLNQFLRWVFTPESCAVCRSRCGFL